MKTNQTMIKKNVAILIMMIVGIVPRTYADKNDVYFPEDLYHFVKIDLVDDHVKFSACNVLQDQQQASCEPIAQVRKSEFAAMRECNIAGLEAAMLIAVAGAFVSPVLARVFLPARYFVGGGEPIAMFNFRTVYSMSDGDVIALLSTIGTSLAVGLGTAAMGYTSVPYSEENENDKDHFHRLSFNEYVNRIRKSLEESFYYCDVSDSLLAIEDSSSQVIRLTSQQIDRLASAKNVK